MKSLICVVIFILLACTVIEGKSGIELVKGHVIINGRVSNFKGNSKTLRIATMGIEDIDQTATLDSLGNFRTEFELLHPQDVELIYESGVAFLYLKPADSLYIEIDGDLFKQNQFLNYKVSGPNSLSSKNIRDFFQFHNPNTFVPNYEKPVKEFLSDLKKQIALEDSVLNEFNKNNKATKEFMTWAKKNITYTLAEYVCQYFFQHTKYKPHKVEILDTDLFPVDDDSAIVSGLYSYYIKTYSMIKFLGEDSIFRQLYKKNDLSGADKRVLNNIIENEKPGLSRDFMIYDEIFSIKSTDKHSFERITALWNDYLINISSNVVLDLLKETKDNFERQQNNKETVLDLKTNTKSETISRFWETLSSKYKNKIIYIDIWATWCGPCRGEISPAIVLHDYFKDKPVAFVNLCLASDKDDWEKVIDKSHLTGDNYFFNEDETNLFRSQLKFEGYPTFMIIDKNGDLVDKNAPRPSTGDEIKNILNKLIDKY
jgi:thiol-disulfide isomerase/thioredoxin